MSDTSARAPLGPGDVDEVVTEIKSLTDRVSAITARFSSVRRMLSRSQPPLDPEDKFSRHRKEYIELTWKSREIAGQAHVAATDFCGNIFDMILDNTVPDADKRMELEGVMENWKNTGASSSQLFQGFEDLCRALDEFGVTLRQRQEVARDEEAALQADIDGIVDRLSALSASMERRSGESTFSPNKLRTLFRNVLRQLSEKGFFGTILLAISTVMFLMYTAACKSLGLSLVLVKSVLTLSPRAAIDAISKTVGDGFAEVLRLKNTLFATEDRPGNSERQQLEGTLTARQAALDNVQRTVNQSSEALEEMRVLKSDVVSLSSQLSSLCDIFNILTRESLALLGLMDSGAPISTRDTKLHAIRSMLAPITRALDAYAKAEGA